MLESMSRFWRNAVLTALAGLVLWFGWSIRSVLNPLLVAYLCAYILHPLVERLVARGRSRRAAVNLIFLSGFLLVGVLSVGLWLQSASLASEVFGNEQLAEKLRVELEHARVALEAQIQRVMPDFVLPDLPELKTWLVEFISGIQQEQAKALGQAGLAAAGGAGNWLLGFFGSFLSVLGFLLLVPLYTYFLLFQLSRVHEFVQRHLPRGERERFTRVAGQIGEVLSNFLRGRLLVGFLKGAILTVGLMIAGVPYALLFGMGSGLLSLIPFLGAFLGFAVAFLVAALDFGVWGGLLRTGIVFGLAELVEGYVLVPKILGDTLGLDPVVVLFSLMAGGAALGFYGVLLALPLTATLVILAREYVLPTLARMAADGDPPRSASP